MDLGLGDESGSGGSGMGLDTRRELVHEGTGQVVARWIENDGSSAMKTGRFEFVGAGAAGVYGSQWEIMAVISVLRIWHEDYHTTKAMVDALAGGG